MKTTTKTAALKRLEKSSVQKSTIAYKIVKDLINGTKETGKVYGNIIRPVYTSGSGRFTSNQNHEMSTRILLRDLGFEFETGNDSPRGGLTGVFIKVTTKIK